MTTRHMPLYGEVAVAPFLSQYICPHFVYMLASVSSADIDSQIDWVTGSPTQIRRYFSLLLKC